MEKKSTIGGIKSFFLTPFKYLPRRHFINDYYGNSPQLKITPLQLSGVSFSSSSSDGFYSQNLSFKTPNLINDSLITQFKNNEYRAVLIDNNKNYWLLGKDNGLSFKGNNVSTGVNKVDFNGYDLSFEGKEIEPLYRLNNIDSFSEDAVLFLSSSSLGSSTSNLTSQKYI